MNLVCLLTNTFQKRIDAGVKINQQKRIARSFYLANCAADDLFLLSQRTAGEFGLSAYKRLPKTRSMRELK